jgi:hypothetical protein
VPLLLCQQAKLVAPVEALGKSRCRSRSTYHSLYISTARSKPHYLLATSSSTKPKMVCTRLVSIGCTGLEMLIVKQTALDVLIHTNN